MQCSQITKSIKTLVGLSGTLTVFHYYIGDAGLAYGGTIIATLFKNGLTTDFTCSVTSGPPTSCEYTGSLSVVLEI